MAWIPINREAYETSCKPHELVKLKPLVCVDGSNQEQFIVGLQWAASSSKAENPQLSNQLRQS